MISKLRQDNAGYVLVDIYINVGNEFTTFPKYYTCRESFMKLILP